jgi:hypothetical protein
MDRGGKIAYAGEKKVSFIIDVKTILMNGLLAFYPIISGFPTLLVIIDFFYFIDRDQRLLRWGTAALEIMILVVPLVLLRVLEVECRLRLGQALFDPAYGGFFYSLIVLCQLAYFYCSFRKRMSPPLVEVIINCLLLTGIALNIVIAARTGSVAGIFFICLPATMLLIMMLVNNHRMLIYTLEDVDAGSMEPALRGRLSSACLYLLQMRPVGKFLLLMTLCLPVLLLLIKILILSCGQSIVCKRWKI